MSTGTANRGSKMSGVVSPGVSTMQVAAPSVLPGWRAEALPFRSFDTVTPLLDGLEGSVFQSRHWLSTWYETLGAQTEIEPFIVLLRDETGTIVLALPLICRSVGGLTMIEFPDLGVSDYAAPLLRPSKQGHMLEPDALWSMIRAALPRADVVRFNQLCPSVQGMPNPLHAHPWARPNRIAGWMCALPDSWDGFCASLSDSMREKLGRNGRRFARVPGNSMTMIEDKEAGFRVLAELEQMQAERIQDMGREYRLNTPQLAAFYRRLVEKGIENGDTVMAEFRVGEEIVAANFGVRGGHEVAYLRMTNRFGEWARMSPGLLAVEFLIRTVHARGVRVFDFGMGDYEYKRRFGAQKMILKDLVLPLSVKGLPYALFWHARHWASGNALIRRLTGRSIRAEAAHEAENGAR